MNKLQALLIVLLCFGLSNCGLTGLNENTKLKTKELSTNESITNLENNISTNKIPLSILSLKEQIERHWRPHISTKELKNTKMILSISLDRNGVAREVKIKDVMCPTNSECSCRLAAESAVKAVRQGSPYKLPPEDYETWKEVNMLFDSNAIYKAEISKPSKNVYVEILKN